MRAAAFLLNADGVQLTGLPWVLEHLGIEDVDDLMLGLRTIAAFRASKPDDEGATTEPDD